MATERVTERDDGVNRERTVERGSDEGTTVVRTGGGAMGAILGIAVLAVVALIAVFLVVQSNRNDPSRQVADAATSIAGSASRAADSVASTTGSAANGAADAVTPN
jgi:hypothetical protein